MIFLALKASKWNELKQKQKVAMFYFQSKNTELSIFVSYFFLFLPGNIIQRVLKMPLP